MVMGWQIFRRLLNSTVLQVSGLKSCQGCEGFGFVRLSDVSARPQSAICRDGGASTPAGSSAGPPEPLAYLFEYGSGMNYFEISGLQEM